MKDRVPINPGRVLITPENGNAAFYATMTRADNPTQEGDPLNKNTLLKDATAALYGLGADAVPDDVLRALKSILDGHATDIAAGAKIATGSYIGTGTYGASNPCSLTFDFVPSLLAIFVNRNVDAAYVCETIIYPQLGVYRGEVHGGNVIPNGTVSVSGNTVQWYGANALMQLNDAFTFHYIALG